jgi:hypothetical protein
MRRDRWTLLSNLWFVFLVALGLKVATGTWHNLKRGSIEYHRQLASGCQSMSIGDRGMAASLEDFANSQSISDPTILAELRQQAVGCAWSAQSNLLLAASLSEKAELCEQSRLGWIVLQYETLRNPPSIAVHHSSNMRPRPWSESATLAAFFRHPIMTTLARVDFFWLACLIVAVVGKRWFARDRGVGGAPAPSTCLD